MGGSGSGVRFVCLEILSGCSFSQLFVLCTPVLEPDLHCTGEHIELGCESLADRGIGLGVLPVDVLENLELRSGRSFSVLDFVGYVREESPEIDRGRVDTGWHDRRNASVSIP